MGSRAVNMQNNRRDLQRQDEQLREEMRKAQDRISALTALQKISRILASELQLEPLLKEIVSSAVQLMEASAGCLILVDPETDELVFSAIEGGGGMALLERRMKKDQGVAGWVVTHGEPLVVNDVSRDERFPGEIEESLGFRSASLVCVPVTYQGRIIGALEVLNKLSGESFHEDDVDLLTTLASQSATAIENARLYQSLWEQRDRIMVLEEEVRKELAHDLHDGPVQLLSAIVTQFQFIRQVMERAPEQLETQLEDAEKLASKALRQLRSMLFGLRPVALETEGLIPAVRAYVELIRREGEIAVHLNVTERREQLPKRIEKNVFSIIQEAVTNIRKHARADNIWITIASQEGRLLVTVKDDGRGFDLAQVERSYGRRGSLGLLRIRERAEVIGGELAIDSTIGEGTIISLGIPLASGGQRSS